MSSKSKKEDFQKYPKIMENASNTAFTFDLPKGSSSIIKVIGVGGGGNNALKHMYEKGIHGVDFVICNTDAQTLDNNPIPIKVQLGATITEGLGAGADPEVGEKAALESIDDIKATLGQNTKMVFITAGMGGGTGTGAAPIIAKIAKEMGILTVGIVTVPFSFEGKRRLDQAEIGLEKLRNNVDSLIVINNDKLRQQFGNLGFKSGFAKADEVLANAAKGMAEVITGYFDVNIDFRDAKSVLENSGTALMSSGVASGENKAEDAVKKALDSPLLNDNKITGAKNVLLLIRSGNEEATMDEIGLINDHIQREAGNTADIIFGVGSDEELGDAISVLVIATGFSAEDQKFSGPIEKTHYKLEDTPSDKPFPFKSSREETPKTENNISETPKNLFALDDIVEEKKPEFTTHHSKPKFHQDEQVAELNFFEEEKEQPIFSFQREEIVEEDKNEEKLFLFDVEEETPESEAFSFQVVEEVKTEKEESFFVEEKPIKPVAEKKEESLSFQQEKPVEFTFALDKTETLQPTETLKEIKTVETPLHVSAKVATEEVHEEFTFINKSQSQEKAQQRRDKLKEFNSRYFTEDAENDFETVPAFRRKNIAIEGTNASEQNITQFLSEKNGKIQLKENRFLNKDVD